MVVRLAIRAGEGVLADWTAAVEGLLVVVKAVEEFALLGARRWVLAGLDGDVSHRHGDCSQMSLRTSLFGVSLEISASFDVG